MAQVIQCTADNTTKRYPRTLVEAFGAYANLGPIESEPEPMCLADSVMLAMSAVALVVVAALIATGN